MLVFQWSGFGDDMNFLTFSDKKSGESQGIPGPSGMSGFIVVIIIIDFQRIGPWPILS